MAIEERIPTSEPVTRVEFSLSSSEYPFVYASTIDDCKLMLEEVIPRGDGAYAEFFYVTDVEPDQFRAIAADHDGEAELVNTYENGALVEFLVADDCPVVYLGERGALPREIFSIDGEGCLVAEIPSSVDASAVVEQFLADHADAELASKQEQPYVKPMFSQRQYRQSIEEELTDRQQTVIAIAHRTGYYSWPREITADELADELGISAPTLHKHLRAAEQTLIDAFFDPPAPLADVSATGATK